MREILFRGKRVDNGKWVYGYIEKRPSAIQVPGYGGPWYILTPPQDPDDSGGCWNVDPATVGQYTGLKDKNGVKIFEGDILQYTFDDIGTQKAIIKYSEKRHTFLMVPLNDFQYAEMESGTIVGNVWDSPELLEGDGHE